MTEHTGHHPVSIILLAQIYDEKRDFERSS
jgi:hypothetical protein